MINKDTYKRLTNSNIFPCPNCIPSSIVGEDGCFIEDTANLRYCIDCPIKKIYDRLVELEDKIKNGMLFESYCKVGDTVYYVGEKIYEAQIKKIIYDLGHMAFDNRAINQSIFLTQEAAEARLKELKGE